MIFRLPERMAEAEMFRSLLDLASKLSEDTTLTPAEEASSITETKEQVLLAKPQEEKKEEPIKAEPEEVKEEFVVPIAESKVEARAEIDLQTTQQMADLETFSAEGQGIVEYMFVNRDTNMAPYFCDWLIDFHWIN